MIHLSWAWWCNTASTLMKTSSLFIKRAKSPLKILYILDYILSLLRLLHSSVYLNCTALYSFWSCPLFDGMCSLIHHPTQVTILCQFCLFPSLSRTPHEIFLLGMAPYTLVFPCVLVMLTCLLTNNSQAFFLYVKGPHCCHMLALGRSVCLSSPSCFLPLYGQTLFLYLSTLCESPWKSC